MKSRDIKIRIIPSYTGACDIVLIMDYSSVGSKESPYGHVMNAEGIFEPIEDELEIPKQGIRLSRGVLKKLTEALINHCDNSNIGLEKEDHLKGRMEATEKHLDRSNQILDSFIKKYLK